MTRAGSAMPLVAIGAGGALAAMLLRSRRAEAMVARPVPEAPAGPPEVPVIPPATLPGVWVVPIPALGDRRPVISHGFRSPQMARALGKRPHLGVDLFYRRTSKTDLAAIYPAGTPHGTAAFFMPADIPALAASAGRVRFAQWTPHGYSIVIEHPGGWATYYTHLARLRVARGDQVSAGQQVGVIGASPKDAEHLVHLHVELWRGGTRSGAVDPAPYLAAWQLRDLPGWTPPAAPVRNASLVYRPVGSRGEPYPDWLRQLSGASGVYVIRQRGEVVYVGSSVADRLYATITRHLQTWSRAKGFWSGQFGKSHDPGLTYNRGSVEVAVKVTSPSRALDEEARLIRRLRPRDNLIGQPAEEEVPF